MEAHFWHQKWQRGDIGFHQAQANPLLVRHLDDLRLQSDARVFLPLCGKTLDIAYLLDRGYRVAGAELSELAVQALFESLNLRPTIQQVGTLKHYRGPSIDIYAGDVFSLDALTLDGIDAIYDRAALVALPADMRKRYAAHLVEISQGAPQLLISYTYDQSLIDGPPFSIPESEVERLYGDSYTLKALKTYEVKGGLKGKVPAAETVWLLERPRSRLMLT
jgi:thiopurine S-methyltransferase